MMTQETLTDSIPKDPNELEGDFYRRRLRTIHHVATVDGEKHRGLDERLAHIAQVADESLKRKRSNGPDWDRFEKMAGDLRSREIDVTALEIALKDAQMKGAEWQVAAREARAELENLKTALGGRWARWGHRIGALLDRRRRV